MQLSKLERGYLAPEYAISGHLTRKSDIYSFGVLLLHMVSGLPVVESNLEQGDTYLVKKVMYYYYYYYLAFNPIKTEIKDICR